MIKKVKDFVRKLIPKKIFKALQPAYHYLIALLSALWYGFPSKSLRVVAITGTKGKTSTAEMVNAILEEAGQKTALGGSLRFKIGDDSKLNPYGMSMPGLGFMQKFLRQAVKSGCNWAVLEMTSEGAKQFRHLFIYPDAFIFTNLAPEHIESHGSLDKYIEHKKRIPELMNSSHKERRVAIINSDSEYADEFTPEKATEKIFYSLEDAKPFSTNKEGSTFTFNSTTIHSPLKGEFNISNMLAAATFAKAFGISEATVSRALDKLKTIRGRGEHVTLPKNHPAHSKQNFDVVVDYAHTIESLEALYKAFPDQKKICVLGNTGGGRDTWKRPGMAKVADTYCDEIILTTEDPYDEDPKKIIEEMLPGIKNKTPKIILDRKEAIEKTVGTASENNVVIISGMGSQQYMCVKNGKKIPWDDAQIARDALEIKLK